MTSSHNITKQRHQEQHYSTINRAVICLDNEFWPKAVYMKFKDTNGGELCVKKRELTHQSMVETADDILAHQMCHRSNLCSDDTDSICMKTKIWPISCIFF